MQHNSYQINVFSALLLAIGIIVGGYFIGDGISKVRVGPRTVKVKGLSEREVNADVAIWPINFDTTANDLKELNTALMERQKAIESFLIGAGFSKEDISVSPPKIIDLHSLYVGASTLPPERYKAEATISIRTGNIKLVKETMGKTTELIDKGVALSGEKYQNSTEFIFTSLNDIKPEMIEEATKNARMTALKFAEDSESRLGAIHNASQGEIVIKNRDNNTPEIKVVRVVTTIEYFLEK